MVIFPEGVDDISKSASVSTVVFGNRLRSDQTLYEYLIEFLLVFSSAKVSNMQGGRMKFHTIENNMSYYVEPRMALRRFVFYDKARKNGSIPADEKAYQEMLKILSERMEGIDNDKAREIIEDLQDLYHGYAVVIKKRAWCAQAMMPICPELIFCGAMPNERYRRKLDWEIDKEKVDTTFDFDKRNFLSRGGEVYYLHILQGLQGKNDKKEKLENLINNLLCVQSKKISKMAAFIQNTWESELNLDETKLNKKINLSCIPATGYVDCAEYSIDELINFLSCKMHPVKRVELLAKGVMFQIMRMMSYRVADYLETDRKCWIVDMRNSAGDTVKKIASEAYRIVEEDFMTALNKAVDSMDIVGDSADLVMKKVHEGKVNSLDIFRAKGKELQCIIPISGAFERFTLSEDIIRFLVLSIISPQEKMTLDMFLIKLYEHYGIVIGPNEYRKTVSNERSLENSLANSFNENIFAFQKFLKSTGFLRELSDATSIVVNPYTDVFEEVE